MPPFCTTLTIYWLSRCAQLQRIAMVMFQAYELSTLTGTQVMLLVASETGHVYTFATRFDRFHFIFNFNFYFSSENFNRWLRQTREKHWSRWNRFCVLVKILPCRYFRWKLKDDLTKKSLSLSSSWQTGRRVYSSSPSMSGPARKSCYFF